MKFREVEDGYLVRLERGEKVIENLSRFVKDQNIPAGFIMGIGAVRDATMGIYSPEKGEYFKKTFKDDLEVGNLTGNISYLDDTGEPVVHCHATIANHSLEASTGHLFEAVVSVTMEIHIRRFKKKLVRIKDPDMGFNFWQL
jgi:predicted DNA-binding protein with PD1-like motif